MGISGHVVINYSAIPRGWGPIGTMSGKAEFKVTMSRSFKGGCSRIVVGFFFFGYPFEMQVFIPVA